jgi:pimeloyl-ACP methyl ester carboxylesterase
MTSGHSPPRLHLPILVQGIFVRQWWRDYASPHERFRVTTRDGVGLRGVHLKTGHDTLVIYCHGFLSSKNFIAVPRFAELLADDVDVIAFDFRGHGESEGASTLGEVELLDVDAVVDYARGVGYRRIILAGSSMGGAVEIRYAASSQEVAGVVTVGAFARGEFSFVARRALGFFDWPVTHSVVRSARRTRVESVALRSAPIDVVHQLTPRPLLLIHGENDLLVPVRHAYELYARACEPKDLIVIPRGSHDVSNLNRRTKDWIIEWIGKSEASDLLPSPQNEAQFGPCRGRTVPRRPVPGPERGAR